MMNEKFALLMFIFFNVSLMGTKEVKKILFIAKKFLV